MDSSKFDTNDHIDNAEESRSGRSSPPLPKQDGSSAESNSGKHQQSSGHSSQAEVLCGIAEELFRFGQTSRGEPFAVEIAGPNLAMMLSESNFKSTLSRLFYKRSSKVPNSSALSDAVSVLKGKALESEPEELPVRITKHEDSVIIDVGDRAGRAIVINIDGWEEIVKSPVVFRRTELTAPISIPVTGGSIDDLRSVINVTVDSFRLLVGWIVSTFIPDIAHPIALLGGQAATGKTTAIGYITELTDPSTAPLKVDPRNIEEWALTASGCWVAGIDNLSDIRPWFSDALCRTVTGDGFVRRKLYSNNELSVLSFRRCILLTSIEPGALRGDLGERLLLIDLEPINSNAVISETALNAKFNDLKPKILGAILDLVVGVMRNLPNTDPPQLPRMADFARVLAALDALDALDGSLFETYVSQETRIAETVIDSDIVADAIRTFMNQRPNWIGTATELLDELTPCSPPKDWPRNPQMLSGRLRRAAPSLGKIGIGVTFDRETTTKRTKFIKLIRHESASNSSSQSCNDANPDGQLSSNPKSDVLDVDF